MTSYGSDYTTRNQQSGEFIADGGATLLSPFSEGETALLAGPALVREIQSGVANGDFAVSPQDPTATISAENNLPYWTYTDVNSGGAITCVIVSDATAGSGNILEWRIAASTTTGKSAKLTRFVPVASTKNRAYAYSPEVNTSAATATTTITMRMQAQYYRADQTTTTGTAIDSGALTFTTLGTGSNWLTGSYTTANAAPSDAAFCLITITVATAGTTPASISTADITEVRLIRGDQTNLFAEYTTPGTYAPTLVRQVNGTLQISPNAGTGATQIGGALNLDTRHTIASNNTSTVIFTRTDTGTRSGVVVGRVFPGDQTTRYIDDDGTYMTTSGAWSTGGGIRTAGSVQNNNGSYYADTPATTSGTGQIANSAQWTLSSGTNWQLRRSTGTSWAKFKTDIAESSISPEQFKALRFVQFHWDGPALLEQYPDLSYVEDEMQHGVLLDQLVDVMPEAIQQPASETDTETVSWHIVHMAAMVALQDAIARIEALEAKVADLESR
jgi:hypothetical protein